MIKIDGFCDLCVESDGITKDSLRVTCERLFNLGYRTVAINQTIDDTVFESKRKKKKGEARDNPDVVPIPLAFEFADEFKKRLQILHRLTISYSDQSNIHKLNQSLNFKKYHIIAVLPNSQSAFQHACGGAFDFDIITFNPLHKSPIKMNRKLYDVLKDRNVYFELMYSPAIRDSTSRKNIIHMSHLYHAYGKSKNIIISSSAAEAFQVRSPYDVINLGLILGLSEEQCKTAILSNCRKLIIRAEGRRHGKAVMIVKQLTQEAFIDSDESDDDMEQLLEPALKKTKL
ncbi:ribonuclease P protein subunit p30 [Ctenocephalides felis]|uniref:ribonuclease P protein subunit p30 n=1 Tax=Ctenocephalides felis TaxID=7515 RepID=UPI000E6E5425|nr:ribonuclease P protein subunit p30 [Ctenocephalides felis]